MKNMSRNSYGFALPIVIITSGALIVLMLALLQSVVSMRTFTNFSYYSKLAEESAEAGTIYAAACIEANGRMPSWGTNTLTETKDCFGVQQTAFVTSTSSADIHFNIGAVSVTPSSVNIQAAGRANIPGLSSPLIGNLSRSITWDTDTTSTKSASGTSRTCGILSGNVYCWGDNTYGQLGNNLTIDSLTPVKVYKETGILSGKEVSNMFAAQDHNCAIAEGEVYCWGRNNYGQLGDGTTTNRSKPVKVSGALAGKTVTAVGGTQHTSCAIAESKIYCWGSNLYGVVGKNSTATSTTSFTTPTIVATAADGVSSGLSATYAATKLTSGSRATNMCAIADGKAYCWGKNQAGQIGNNVAPSSTTYRAPVAVYSAGVLSGKTVTSISLDGYSDDPASPNPPPYTHVCVVANDAVYCWGENNSGQLGNASTTDTRAPIATSTSGVLSGKTIIDVVAGISHSCALSSIGKVYCWGSNASGQIGDNTSTTRTSPVAVYEEAGALLNVTVTTIAGGANRGCATANGKSFCWGLNSDGQIGDGTTTNRRKPTESTFMRPKNDDFVY